VAQTRRWRRAFSDVKGKASGAGLARFIHRLSEQLNQPLGVKRLRGIL